MWGQGWEAGFLLAQAGYRGSGLGAPLATVTLVNPAAATVIGLALLGERYAGGGWGVAAALAVAALAVTGVVLLVRQGPPAPVAGGGPASPPPMAAKRGQAVSEPGPPPALAPGRSR